MPEKKKKQELGVLLEAIHKCSNSKQAKYGIKSQKLVPENLGQTIYHHCGKRWSRESISKPFSDLIFCGLFISKAPNKNHDANHTFKNKLMQNASKLEVKVKEIEFLVQERILLKNLPKEGLLPLGI